MGKNLKCTTVGDVYIPQSIMKEAVRAFPHDFSLNASLFWGYNDKKKMREKVRSIETGGAYAEQPPRELTEVVGDTDILLVHLCPVPSHIIRSAKHLKLIASARGGVENIDIQTATSLGIPVISNPAHNANAVAEMTVGMMIVETRNICRSYYALKRSGIWRETYPNKDCIRELESMKVGLIGFGTIGKLVAKKLNGFGCEIYVFDPYVAPERIEEAGCISCSLEQLLKIADIVSLHTRVNRENFHMIGEKEFANMKKTAYFINTSRATLVDTKALYCALKNNIITGAAIDVFDAEPIDSTHPLLELDNITFTNHRGGDTVESYSKSPYMVLAEAKRCFEGNIPRFLANPEALDACK